jgi:hypothetical protein
MKTVATILELAAPLQAGFYIRIENEPCEVPPFAVPNPM